MIMKKTEQGAQRLAEVVPQLMSAFHDFRRPQDGARSLTMRHFQALVLLSVRGEMTVTDLCDRLHLAPSTGSELAQRMIALGLVQKSYENIDRREVSLKLTDLGLDTFQQRKLELVQIFQGLLERFSAHDQDRLLQAFDTIWEIMSGSKHARQA